MRRYPICLSLYGTNDEISKAILAHPIADLYEIRLDLSPALEHARLRDLTPKPIIFTAHDTPDLLKDGARFANFLDVGPDPEFHGPEYIVSYHGEEGNPEKLWQKYQGEHLTKIALETENYEVIWKLLELNSKHHPKALCFATGDVGNFSRVLALFKGALWIYACIAGRPTGTGQMRIRELVEIYRLPRFNSMPAVFGIVGDPVAHSRSPLVQNQMFASGDLPWIYLPFLCKDLRSLLDHAAHFGITGLSITHPYKKEVIQYLDDYQEEVKALQACNTICLQNGRWKGINTDIMGIEALLQSSGTEVADKRVMILGAGGAARAIAMVVGPQARELRVLNRNVERARELASIYGGKGGSLEEFGKFPYDILFQATSIGMKTGESAVNPSFIRKGTTVIDAIYEPSETLLLQRARELGCRTVNGEAWFQAQAEAQFRWWASLFKH